MRFIGSKIHLLKEIDGILEPHLTGKEQSFVDLFAGSNVVAKHFKQRYAITTNDLMSFSQAISLGSIVPNSIPTYQNLKKIGVDDPFKWLISKNLDDYSGGFVTEEYSPSGKASRMYLQIENAKRIDFIRDTIDSWYKDGIIDSTEFYYLLNALLQGIPYVSNITGTYGAYLKRWDKRSYKPLQLIPAGIKNNGRSNRAYCEDGIELSKRISGDILYIDTPYNNRQYAPNYHVLEEIAKNNKPQLHGITGQPDSPAPRSDFALKRRALSAMENLLKDLSFSHVVVSYSTDGIISEDEMIALIKNVALDGKFEEKRISYRKYKSRIVKPNDELFELLFYFQPQKAKLTKINDIKKDVIIAPTQKITHSAGGYIKSPLNYVGGKYKLLPQIMPLFPKKVDIFVDLFSGGGNVGINADASQVIFNDVNTKIIELFRFFQDNNSERLLNEIYSRIDYYQLSKTNEAGFLRFRQNYNEYPTPLDLYVLVAYSFNYQFRFNSKMEYNNPFGRNRSHFSMRMANNLVKFVDRLNSIYAVFTDKYFTQLDLSSLTENSFVYADPPYLITTGSYNDGNRGFVNWTEKQEKELYCLLDSLTNRGIRFALSNVTDHKGKANNLLKSWMKRYNVHELKYGYQHSSHNTVNLNSSEVLITNY